MMAGQLDVATFPDLGVITTIGCSEAEASCLNLNLWTLAMWSPAMPITVLSLHSNDSHGLPKADFTYLALITCIRRSQVYPLIPTPPSS